MPAAENGDARLDRIEAILEALATRHAALENTLDRFQDELQHLLTAQVVLTETVDKLTDKVDQLAEKVDKLADAQNTTQENLNALIAVVDDIVRRLPPRQQ